MILAMKYHCHTLTIISHAFKKKDHEKKYFFYGFISKSVKTLLTSKTYRNI